METYVQLQDLSLVLWTALCLSSDVLGEREATQKALLHERTPAEALFASGFQLVSVLTLYLN